MSHIAYQGPFIKAFYANAVNAGTRFAGNPALPDTYSSTVKSPLRRIYLLIQNKGTVDIELDLNPSIGGSVVNLAVGQSISLDNFNGGFTLSSYTNAVIVEAFA